MRLSSEDPVPQGNRLHWRTLPPSVSTRRHSRWSLTGRTKPSTSNWLCPT